MKQNILSFLLVAAACTGGFAFATETENLNMQVLPAPGKVVVDTLPSLKYRMTVGRSGSPPYRTPDGKGDWGANLGGGTGIAAHWAGLSESRVVDRPGSAELLSRTWGNLKFASEVK
jgi:hypothetical protein